MFVGDGSGFLTIRLFSAFRTLHTYDVTMVQIINIYD